MKQKHKAIIRASTALANVLFLASGGIAIYIVVKEPQLGRTGLLPLAVGDLLFGLLSIASCTIAHIPPPALLTAYTAATALSLAGFLHLCYTVVVQSYHFERQHVEKLFYTIIAIYSNAQLLRGAMLMGCWNSLWESLVPTHDEEPSGKKIITLKNSAQTLVDQQQQQHSDMYDQNWMSSKQPDVWQVTSIDRDVLKYQNYDTTSEASCEDKERFSEVLLPPFLPPPEQHSPKIPEDMGDLSAIPELVKVSPWQDFSSFADAAEPRAPAKTLISLDSWEKNSEAWLASRERQGGPSALLVMSGAQQKLTSIPELQPPPKIDAMPQRPKYERSVSAPSLLSSSSSTAATEDSIEEFVETTMRRTMSISKLSESSIYETQRTIPSQPSLYTELSRSRSRYTTASSKSRSRSTSPFKKIKELTSSMSSSPTRTLHARHASNKSCNFPYLHSIQNSPTKSPSKSQHTVTKSVTSLGTFTNSMYSGSPIKQRVSKIVNADSPKSNWSETSESSSVPSLAVGQYDKEKWRTLKQMTKC